MNVMTSNRQRMVSVAVRGDMPPCTAFDVIELGQGNPTSWRSRRGLVTASMADLIIERVGNNEVHGFISEAGVDYEWFEGENFR